MILFAWPGVSGENFNKLIFVQKGLNVRNIWTTPISKSFVIIKYHYTTHACLRKTDMYTIQLVKMTEAIYFKSYVHVWCLFNGWFQKSMWSAWQCTYFVYAPFWGHIIRNVSSCSKINRPFVLCVLYHVMLWIHSLNWY